MSSTQLEAEADGLAETQGVVEPLAASARRITQPFAATSAMEVGWSPITLDIQGCRAEPGGQDSGHNSDISNYGEPCT